MKSFYLIFCFFFFLNFSAYHLTAQSVVINEVMASNGNTLADEDGDYEDWIELYNTGEEVVNLGGWGLSDDYDRPFRWVLPAVELHPGGYLLVWASNKDRDNPNGELHTNFAISSSGEEVILTRPDGERIDEVEPRPIPRDLSWARYPDGADEWFYFENATPGYSNEEPSYVGLLETPIFSHDPGFYSESFMLEINHPNPDVTLYYTLDGTSPTTESILYDGPIEIYDRSVEENVYSLIPTNTWPAGHSRGWNPPAGLINKGNVIRIKAFADDLMPAELSGSFFVFPNKEEEYPLPVFSIITDPVNFFDDSIGIYVPGINHSGGDAGTGNFRERGIDWERPAHLSFFEEGEEVISQEVGLRIHGGYTRRFPQKSLRVYARSQYGENSLDYDFFGDGLYESYKRILLRQSGNDWNFSMFRDGTIQDVWEHVGMEGQRFRSTVAFVNGEFWGIHHIRERQDKHYLNRKFGLEEDEIDVLTRNMVVKEGDSLHYQAMIDFIEANDLSSNENLEQLATMMDLENFMDYYSLQCYCGNTDWPHNNIDYWRKRVDYTPDAPYGHDGRWRWLVYDLDRCLGYSNSLSVNMMNWMTSPTGNDRGAWATFVIRSLLQNEDFSHQFINRMADHLNTTFQEDRVRSYVDRNRNVIADVMEEHIHRWRRPSSINAWNSQVNSMRNFAQQRPNRVRNHIRSYFQINSNIDITLDVNDQDFGKVVINSLTIDSEVKGLTTDLPYPWTGIYFHNIPVDLSADPNPGYQFDYWTIAGDTIFDQNLQMAFESNTNIMAHFSVDSTFESFPEPWVVDECAYIFDYWSEDAEVGTFPENMAFVYMDEEDPGLDAGVEGFTEGVYFLDNRTRINGLGEEGFSFINTGNRDGNPGYPGRRLGGAILGVSTLDVEELYIKWEGGTVTPNSRVYHLRLQYRIGDEGEFTDILDADGNPVEYIRSEDAGHSEIIGPVALPEEAMDAPYVQLLWRYYYTGERLDDDSGARDQLRVGHIVISTSSEALENYDQNDFRPSISLNTFAACFDSSAVGGLIVEDFNGIPPLNWVVEEDTLSPAADVIWQFAPGIYSYELSDGQGCTNIDSFEIGFSEQIAIEWESIMPTCTGDEDGSIKAHISGGSAPISYEWSTGAGSGEFERFVLWDFNGKVPADSPETTEGEGEAVLIGGVNNPESGTSGNGSSDPADDNDAWQTTGYPAQGMSPRTAGVQFNVSTEGYENIEFLFDQRLSNTAANTWVLYYTTDWTADSVEWTEAAVFRVEPQLTGTGNTWYNRRGADLSEVKELNDNPNVAFRIVSDFDPETGQYESARLDRDYGGGTSRWDMVEVYGNPVNRTAELTGIPGGEYSLTVTDGFSCVWEETFVLEEPEAVPVPEISGLIEVDGGEFVVYNFIPDNIGDFTLEVEVENAEMYSFSPVDILIRWIDVPAGEVLEGVIRITLIDDNGCTEEFELTVLIFGPTSTQELSEEFQIDIYPNPNRGDFEISLGAYAAQKVNKIELYTTSGQLIRQILTSGDEEIRISEQSFTGGWIQVVMKDDRGEVLMVRPVLIME